MNRLTEYTVKHEFGDDHVRYYRYFVTDAGGTCGRIELSHDEWHRQVAEFEKNGVMP